MLTPGATAIVLSLLITYSPNYPDEAPEMAVELLEGEFDDDGLREMERELQGVVSACRRS